MPSVELTEFTDLDPDELHLVKRGANGFPALLAKSVAEEIEAAAGEDALEKGKKIKQVTTWPVPKAKKSDSPEADAQEELMTTEKSSSSEADAQQEEMTDEAAKSLCYVPDCEVCAPLLAKAKLKASQRRALPKSDFAVPSKAPKSGSYPVNDEAHARNALARSSGKPEEAQVRAKVKRKFPNIGAKKSPGVPDFSVETPREAGHERSTGESGKRIAPMTTGTEPILEPRADILRDKQSPYVIPLEAKLMTKGEVHAITELLSAFQRQQLAKDAGGFMAQDNAAPGSPAWESYDSATLADIASTLASCGKAIDAMMRREAIEAAAGDVGDVQDTWDLQQAGDALDAALGIVARLSFHEGAEKATGTDLASIRERLTDVFGESTQPITGDTGSTQKETITVETSVEELGKSIATAVEQAVDARDKAAKKEAKKAKKAAAKAEAKKNSPGNTGDITLGDMQGRVNGRADADDVGSVGNGVVKEAKRDSLKKQFKELKERFEKVAAQPRTGGPILDGQPRGATASADGQSGTVVKSVDGHDYSIATPEHIEKLRKQLDEELGKKGPEAAQRASQLGYELTRAQLMQGHVTGAI